MLPYAMALVVLRSQPVLNDVEISIMKKTRWEYTVQIDGEQMILGDESEDALARKLIHYEGIFG